MATETFVPREQIIVVGLGEIQVTRRPSAILTCVGLGSCIAICAYDRIARVGGLAHIVLPTSDGKPAGSLAKYADTGVPILIKRLIENGGRVANLVVKLAGGSQMSLAGGFSNTFKTGERNLAEVKTALFRENIAVAASDTGGTKGRSVRLYIETGRVTVRSVGMEEREL
jgi:chemotaxis protein CheD